MLAFIDIGFSTRNAHPPFSQVAIVQRTVVDMQIRDVEWVSKRGKTNVQ